MDVEIEKFPNKYALLQMQNIEFNGYLKFAWLVSDPGFLFAKH